MAKPTLAAVSNWLLADAAVSIPMTLAELLTSGPPESPGWIGAFVWMSPDRLSALSPLSLPTVIDWFRAWTTPLTADGVPPTPPALPMATTSSPTATAEELPVWTVASPEAPFSWITATSSVGSVPTTLAVYFFPVVTDVTLMLVALRPHGCW